MLMTSRKRGCLHLAARMLECQWPRRLVTTIRRIAKVAVGTSSATGMEGWTHLHKRGSCQPRSRPRRDSCRSRPLAPSPSALQSHLCKAHGRRISSNDGVAARKHPKLPPWARPRRVCGMGLAENLHTEPGSGLWTASSRVGGHGAAPPLVVARNGGRYVGTKE